MNKQTSQESKEYSLVLASTPILLLVILMGLNVWIFGDGASSGPAQLSLIFVSVYAAALAIFKWKIPYAKIQEGIVSSIQMSMVSCLILMIVGSVIGIWIAAGVVPTIIYYGLKIIHPTVFLPVAALSCCFVSVATGSSWTTTGTIGLALVAIGKAYGIPEGMIGGAIISGAYFGDKMSPLSDTTNLAPAMAGTDLFTHIKHMMITTVPAMTIALIIYAVIGIFYPLPVDKLDQVNTLISAIQENFNIGPHLLLIPGITLAMVAKRVPAIPALIISIFLGIIGALIFQQPFLTSMAGGELTLKSAYQHIFTILASGTKVVTGNATIDSLFSRGGMSSMMSTIWLILAAMSFGGVLEATGILNRLANALLASVHSAGQLVWATLASCFFTNVTACDQYISIVLPGRMFRSSYQKFGLAPQNLSRALEDSGTCTSALIPWNTCGAYHSGVLGISALSYAPFAFFNILSPLVSAFVAGINYKMTLLSDTRPTLVE